MRDFVRTSSLFLIVLVPLAGCGVRPQQDGPPKETVTTEVAPIQDPVKDGTAATGTEITLHVEGMVWEVGWVSRAKKALASLPWVDQKSVKANIEAMEVKFMVPDMKQFNREQLFEAFKKHNFPNTKLVSPAT